MDDLYSIIGAANAQERAVCTVLIREGIRTKDDLRALISNRGWEILCSNMKRLGPVRLEVLKEMIERSGLG